MFINQNSYGWKKIRKTAFRSFQFKIIKQALFWCIFFLWIQMISDDIITILVIVCSFCAVVSPKMVTKHRLYSFIWRDPVCFTTNKCHQDVVIDRCITKCPDENYYGFSQLELPELKWTFIHFTTTNVIRPTTVSAKPARVRFTVSSHLLFSLLVLLHISILITPVLLNVKSLTKLCANTNKWQHNGLRRKYNWDETGR